MNDKTQTGNFSRFTFVCGKTTSKHVLRHEFYYQIMHIVCYVEVERFMYLLVELKLKFID